MAVPYLDAIRNEFPKIRPYREDDLEWRNQGFDQLADGQIDQAERTFKQLTLSQPDHWDGCEGLAALYRQRGLKPQAQFFIQEAIRRAEVSLRNDEVDPEVIDDLKALALQIEALPSEPP